MKIKKFIESIVVTMFLLGLIINILLFIHWNNYFKANKIQEDILEIKNNEYTYEKYINFKVFTTLKIYKENNHTLGEITKFKLENSKEFYEIVNKRK